MRIKRFNENESNIPTKQDMESMFASALHNADKHIIVPAKIVSKSWYTGVNDKENVVWTIDPISAIDDESFEYNGFVINLEHNFYNPSSSVYNSLPVVEDFYKYTEMTSDLRSSLLEFQEEYPNAQIRFDMSKDSWLILQIKLF